MKKIIFFLLIAFMPFGSVLAQTRNEKQLAKEKEAKRKRDEKERKKREKKEKKEKAKIPENIEVFPKNFLFKPKFAYPSVIFNVSSRKKNGENFNWKPSIPGVVGAAIRIKKVYVSAAFKLPSDKTLIKQYCDTKYTDIFINIQGRITSWGFFYRDYKGYYLKDYGKFYSNWNEDSLGYPKSNNLHVIEGGLNIGFNFNKNFSLNAAFAQSERQKKSAGSFLMNISERYQRIETDTNIVPPGQKDNYPNLDRLQAGDFLTTLISFGAGYQFVMGKFHLTPVLLAGTGVQFQSYVQSSFKRFWINVPTYVNGRAQFGYNGDNFFANVIYGIEFNTIPIKESRIRLYYQNIEFGLGIRF
ncbi:MAG: DUF4421 family protein [Bacteroidia bacterium]|nr:DUF4421 family protein [Bacteroidia bacterium]